MAATKISIMQPANDTQAPHATNLVVSGWLDYVSTIQPTVSGWIIYNNTKIAGTGGFNPLAAYPNPNWQLTFNINAIPAGTACTLHVRALVAFPPQAGAR